MNKAYRYRIYPTKEQEELLVKTFGCCRFIYNTMLADKIEEYKATGKMLKTTPAKYKVKYPWLKEVDSLALANVQLHLEKAYRNFFEQRAIGFPRFKSKHRSSASYTTNVVNGNIDISDGRLKLPKLKSVKIKLHRTAPEHFILKSVTISCEPSGKYYASLLYEYAVCESQSKCSITKDYRILGMDYAMNGMAVCSDGRRIAYPGYYKEAESKLAREQRKLSRCEKGSSNYRKQKKKVALCHENIRNQRKDFMHKLSRELAVCYDAIAVEDLDMKALSQCLYLGKGIMDNGYGMFLKLLSYKLREGEKKLVKVGRFFPSSKLCSRCGEIKRELKLSDRKYICSCGYSEDRDVNAAINIREEGKRILCA